MSTPSNTVFGNAPPQVEGDPFNQLDFFIRQWLLANVNTAKLVKVLACTNSGAVARVGTVDVQPLVNQMSSQRNPTPHGKIVKLPYFRVQGGDNALIMDPKVGDVGVAVFCDRDISALKNALLAGISGPQNPGSFAAWDWADGLYLGGFLNGIPTRYIQFDASGNIVLHTAGDITLDSPLTTATGDLAVEGDATVTGDSTLTGPVMAPAGITTTTIAGDSAVFSGSVTASSFIGGGGGGGSVTSVTLGSTTLTIGGTNPITGSGTFTVDLSSGQLADLALGASALQAVAINATYFAGNGTSGTPLTLSSTFLSALAATAAAATSALALATTALQPSAIPLTTKGDLFGFSTVDVRVPVGTTGDVLTADPTAAAGVSWQPGGGGPSPGFPTTLPNLQYWFDASLLNADAASNVPLAQNSTPALAAMSPITNTCPSPQVSATQLNSKNVVTLNGSNQGWVFTAGGMFLPESTAFVVFNSPAVSTTQAVFSGGAAGSLEFYVGAASLNLADAFVAVLATSSAVLSNSTWYQANYTYDSVAGNYAFRVAQAAAGSGSGVTSTINSMSNGICNTPGFGQWFGGSIAEIIVYDRVLTAPEIASVEAYLFAKWGV